MSTTPQTEAGRLADGLLAETSKFGKPSIQRGLVNGAIQELRRLDAENQQLKKQAFSVRSHLVDSLAFSLCEKDGNDDPHHLIWDGQPENGPWGEVWQKYLPDAEALAETAFKSATDFGMAFDKAEAEALEYAIAERDQLREQLALAVAKEREECAKVCESRYMGDNNREDMEAQRCAYAIRARGEAV